MIPQERVTFRNQRGQTLVGVLHGEPSARMAITCHGMLSTKDGPKHVLLADTLASRGIGTLRFDFAGRGESEGQTRDLTYSGEVEDLRAGVELLVGLGATRLGVFGSSMGGSVAVLAAAREERITAVATLAAVAYPAEVESRYPEACAGWRERGYIDLGEDRIDATFLADANQHDVIAAASVLRAPLLVLHGADDEVVPVSDATDLAAAARNVSLHIVDGADHRFTNPIHLRPAMFEVAEFLHSEI